MSKFTGLGSLPATDVASAARLALGSVSMPWLPELPARGPWAGMIGRSVALLTELSAGFAVGEWRLSDHPGIDQRRARSVLRDDVEIFSEQAQGYQGPLKLSVCGPWTLAASLLRPRGGRVLADRGARRDLAQSLLCGVADWIADVQRQIPGATVRLQVDEPAIAAVLDGGIPTEGGYFRHRAVGEEECALTLRWFAELTDDSLVHCCGRETPVPLLVGDHGARFVGLSVPGAIQTNRQWEALGEAVSLGTSLYVGVSDGVEGETNPDLLRRRALGWLRPLELGPQLADRLWLTHDCGLAGAPYRQIPGMFEALGRAAEQVDDALRT